MTLRVKFYYFRVFIKNLVKRLWPNEGTSVKGKLWTHIRGDTILIGLTGLFLLVMTFLYNQKILIDSRNSILNLLMSILNPILMFIIPNKWSRVKQNVRYKQSQTHNIDYGKRNPLLIGGIALFLGFSIFMTLLVNNYNELVLNAKSDTYVKQLLTTTSEYIYLSIFVAVVLALFTVLLFFAAKTNVAPKILSNLIIGISVVIILTAIYFLFQKKSMKKLKIVYF